MVRFLLQPILIIGVPHDLTLNEVDHLFGDIGSMIGDALQDRLKQAGLEVSAGSYVGQDVSKPSTESSEVIGLAVAVIVLLSAFGTAVAMSLPITGNGDETRDFTYVLDIVQGLVKSGYSERAVGQVFNIGNGSDINIIEMAHRINDMTGNRAGITVPGVGGHHPDHFSFDGG